MKQSKDPSAPLVPATFRGPDQRVWRACGLNECIRLAKYTPGDEFQAHYDVAFLRSPSERSCYTVNINLNGGFAGGRTRFFANITFPGFCDVCRSFVEVLWAARRCSQHFSWPYSARAGR